MGTCPNFAVTTVHCDVPVSDVSIAADSAGWHLALSAHTAGAADAWQLLVSDASGTTMEAQAVAGATRGRLVSRGDDVRLITDSPPGFSIKARPAGHDWGEVEAIGAPTVSELVDAAIQPDGRVTVLALTSSNALTFSVSGVSPVELTGFFPPAAIANDAADRVVLFDKTSLPNVMVEWSGGGVRSLSPVWGEPRSIRIAPSGLATSLEDATYDPSLADGYTEQVYLRIGPVADPGSGRADTPRVARRMTVLAPDVCPSEVATEQLGVGMPLGAHDVMDVAGEPWFAILRGPIEGQCTWYGACFETAPCDCNQREEISYSSSLELYRSPFQGPVAKFGEIAQALATATQGRIAYVALTKNGAYSGDVTILAIDTAAF